MIETNSKYIVGSVRKGRFHWSLMLDIHNGPSEAIDVIGQTKSIKVKRGYQVCLAIRLPLTSDFFIPPNDGKDDLFPNICQPCGELLTLRVRIINQLFTLQI